MNDIEENFYSVLEELDAVKEQLSQAQGIPQAKEARSIFGDLSGQLQKRVESLQGQISGMRASLNEKAERLVRNFKENGVSALNHVCEFLGVKDKLTQLKSSLVQTAKDMQSSMDRIDRVSQELGEGAVHVKNAGRAVMGKEALEMPAPKENGFFHQMKRPYQSMKDFCLNSADKLEKDIAKLTLLEQRAGKNSRKEQEKISAGKSGKESPSIMEKLKSLQKAQEGGRKETPVAAKAKKQEAAL